MARPESQALAGYFPTPPELLASVASLVELRPLAGYRRHHILVDPCAGEGHAIETLCRLWLPDQDPEDPPIAGEIFGIELEAVRYSKLAGRLLPYHHFHGDAFHFAIAGAEEPGQGASLLFLNPPYDTDKLHGRLEQRFLERWTACLAPGAGVLVFVVPAHALAASAGYLARHFETVRAWRFPGKLFAAFRQVVLLARRRAAPAPEDELVRRRVERWAADPSQLPELELQATPLYAVSLELPRLDLEQTALDLGRLVSGFRPWEGSTLVAAHRTVREMIGAPYPVALPPRPAHIALALSAGMLNGKRIAADRPGLPPLLVKGSLQRAFVTADERFNRAGEKVGAILVQRPRLTLHVLRLDTLEFHQLAPGTHPTGATEIAGFNSADLVEQYGASLGRLMRDQFPAIHDPSNPAHAIELPRLARRPLRRQREVIAAGLKLLALGENPVATAEVGTGKSTVALSIAGALHPLNFAATAGELGRLGFDTRRLRPIRRLLIVCPPHLLGTWAEEAAAVLPLHRIVVVETFADLARDGEIYILSRETAKLGHAVLGLQGGRCPRCGADVGLDPEALASSRARCGHIGRRARDRTARLAERLAALLVACYPYDPHVRQLVRHRRILRLSLPDLPGTDGDLPAGTAPDPAALRPVVLALAKLVAGRCRRQASARDHESALHHLCLAAGMQEEIRDQLNAAAAPYRQAVDPARLQGRQHSVEVQRRDLVARQLTDLAARMMQLLPDYTDGPDAIACLASLVQAGRWQATDPCGEPLFQAAPQPRRYPLARYIMKRCRSRFDLVVLDEAHEFSTLGSAQQKAAHRLVELPGVPTIALSGSMMGGYASSLFANFWALSPRFRRQFRRHEKQSFVSRYGLRKVYVPYGQEAESQVVGYGATSDREETREAPEIRQLGEAPGILPSFILDHLLPVALVMHKEDLEDELPPYHELPVPIAFGDDDPYAAQLAAEYRRVIGKLAEQIRKDLFSSLAGKLWGAMCEMPSYLDRATDDLPPFVVRYPDDVGGAVVTEAKSFPAAWLTPKERWLVDRVRQYLCDGRNVIIFLRHTGTTALPKRYQALFRLHLGEPAVFLDVTRVKATHRKAWLNDHVIRPGRRLLITNAKAVQTGLNNLVHFSRAIWAEGLDCDARVVRQGNGRLHRIGQTRDVLIEVPYYIGTTQKTALDHVARKVTASVQVDGLSIEGALESAGAGDDDESVRAAMGMGQALYEAWLRR
jgi:hypothetical protein